jgi:hypothetical protein
VSGVGHPCCLDALWAASTSTAIRDCGQLAGCVTTNVAGRREPCCVAASSTTTPSTVATTSTIGTLRPPRNSVSSWMSLFGVG